MQGILLPLTAFLTAGFSGIVGFGGAILLLPVLAGTVGVAKAVPILTIIQIIGNASRVAFARKEIDWKIAGTYLTTAVPFAMLGAYSFVNAPKALMLKVVAAAILVFIGLKLSDVNTKPATGKGLMFAGAIVGYISGLIGTAGPLSAAIFMSMNLSPLGYISTDAFCSLVMHTAKAIVYKQSFGCDNLSYSLLITMSLATITGTFLGTKIAAHIPKQIFKYAITTLLVCSALQMLIAA